MLVNARVDLRHWFIARSRGDLKRGEVICLLGEERTFIYTVVSRSLKSDSLLVRYQKQGWKGERSTIIYAVHQMLERGIILIHDGSSRA